MIIKKQDFLNKIKYLDHEGLELVSDAFDFATKAHKNQKRESGELYISHPINIAVTLANLNLDSETLAAALLHDTVEDTEITLSIIEKKFNKKIAIIVDGLTKLQKIKFESRTEKNAENFRKLIMAMSKDIRILIVKLADRLHNMQTISAKQKEKRIRIAQETLIIYVPLAERIGMYNLKNQLEDLAFEQLYTEERKSIIDGIQKTTKNKKNLIDDIIKKLLNKIKVKKGIECIIYGRQKRPYSIWKKLQNKNLSLDHLSDIVAFRILVNNIETCYQVLGIINSNYRMIPGKFKDYISSPKANGYQSIHSIVLGPRNTKIEVQIRTHHMHRVAEFGIASHWLYKEDITDHKHLEEYKWIRELVTSFEKSKNIISVFNDITLQLHKDEVFCFTPKGDLFNLPKGSTGLDFAYSIHSEIGEKCANIKINSSLVQLKTELQNGDTVEITTSKNAHPTSSWIQYVKSSKAKSEIRHYLRLHKQQEYENLGRKIMTEYSEELGINIDNKTIENNLSKFRRKNLEEFYAFIGEGLINKQEVIKKIYPHRLIQNKTENFEEKIKQKEILKIKDKKNKISKKQISIAGLIPGMAIKFAKCCYPIPGDEIIGIINTGVGVSIHKKKCSNLNNIANKAEKTIELDWNNPEGFANEKYTTKIITSISNKTGSLANLINLIASKNINIPEVNTINQSDAFQEIQISIEIQSLEKLRELLASARTLKCILLIERA